MLTPFETNLHQLQMLFRENLIFFLSETKIDESFPDKQFCLNNFKIFRKDKNQYGGGIMFYVNENLPCKSLTTEIGNLT